MTINYKEEAQFALTATKHAMLNIKAICGLQLFHFNIILVHNKHFKKAFTEI